MVMKRLSLASILFLLAFFVSGTLASEDFDQQKWYEAKESTEQEAQEQTSQEAWYDVEESTEQEAQEQTSQEAWYDVEESTEQGAQEQTSEEDTETSEEDTEQTAPEAAEVSPPESGVKYVIERQLKNTGLIFLPYGPGGDSLGEIRPSESYPEGVLPKGPPRFRPIEPIVSLDDEKKEGTKQEEGGEENEEGENDDDETVDY